MPLGRRSWVFLLFSVASFAEEYTIFVTNTLTVSAALTIDGNALEEVAPGAGARISAKPGQLLVAHPTGVDVEEAARLFVQIDTLKVQSLELRNCMRSPCGNQRTSFALVDPADIRRTSVEL